MGGNSVEYYEADAFFFSISCSYASKHMFTSSLILATFSEDS